MRDGILGEPPDDDGCTACLAMGSTWVHLRRCLACGGIGCCDDSPNKHASAHARDQGHPLVQSYEPGEDWVWCYVDQRGFARAEHRGSPSHP